MRKRFLLSLLVALLPPLSTHAYDFKSGDLYYYITSDTTVEVTSQESWSESNYQGLTTATIPETVTNNGSTYSVTSIGARAFCYCSSLTSITIGNSVTSIGNEAFRECSSLISIILPNSVTSIGYYAFEDCSSLPVEDNLRYADTYLVEAVDKSLSTYSIKAGTKWIGDGAFYGCSSLISVSLGNSVTSIGDHAFYNCSSLTSITIPNSVTSIGKSAFYNCSALTSVTLPNSVTSIGDHAFEDCSSLTSITIPNSVTSIGNYAFKGCSSLTSIILPNSVSSIGYRAFSDCSALTSITLPNSVTSIGDRTFAYCSSLTSITIGNSVTSIGHGAFADCSKLVDIYCYATTPPVCYVDTEYGTFVGVSKHCYIHVPAGTVQDYQLATGWSDFFYYYEIEEEEQAIQTAEQDSLPSRKIIRDGQVLILRNGVAYDMMGQRM